MTTAVAMKRGALPAFLLAALAILVLMPMGFIALSAFSETAPRPGNINLGGLTLANFRVLASDYAVAALLNSFAVGSVAALAGLTIGGSLAFLCARTDIPFRKLIYFSGLMPLFLPSYIGALAWAILAGPSAGLFNVLFKDLGINISFDLYHISGLAFVLAIYNAPYAFLFIHGALSLANPDLEDAAFVHGAGQSSILSNVTIPLLLPAILGSVILIFGLSIENFAVSQVIGTPGKIETLPTLIYRLMNAFPAQGSAAAAVAVMLTVLLVLGTLAQRLFMRGRSFTTVSGKGIRPRLIKLGRWRWILFSVASLYFVLAVLLPILALLLVALSRSQFISSFTQFATPGSLSLRAFSGVLSSGIVQSASWNSVVVSFGAAFVGTVFGVVLTYVVYRTKVAGRALIEYVAMLPLAVPAIVFGIGLLWTWLVLPVPIYGTLLVLIVAFVAHQIPQGYRGIASSIQQIHKDLEDSAVMLGASRPRAVSYITVPLMRVGITSTFLLLLLLSMRELSVPLFLFTSETRLLSIVIFDDLENGLLQRASATSVLYCVLIFCFALVALRIGKVKFEN